MMNWYDKNFNEFVVHYQFVEYELNNLSDG